jgi:hypothetical protein
MNLTFQNAMLTGNIILNNISPRDRWIIVNIAQTENQVFSYPSIPELPTCFGYVFDKVPQILEEEGVIEAKINGLWFLKISSIKKEYLGKTGKDSITVVARHKGYIKKTEIAEHYIKYDKYLKLDTGPKARGQYSVLINVNRLRLFINWYSGLTPIFNDNNKTLEFLNEKIQFNGDVNIKSIKLLIDNINSMVSNKDFYEIPRGLTNYNELIKHKGKTKVHESLKKIFKEIENKIKSNNILKNVLIPVQKDGYGIFINNKKLQLPKNNPKAT